MEIARSAAATVTPKTIVTTNHVSVIATAIATVSDVDATMTKATTTILTESASEIGPSVWSWNLRGE